MHEAENRHMSYAKSLYRDISRPSLNDVNALSWPDMTITVPRHSSPAL